MGLFKCWVELLITQDCAKFTKVTTELKNAGITYKESIQNIGHGNRENGQLGSLGENASYSNMYQIYVQKADSEQAKAIASRN